MDEKEIKSKGKKLFSIEHRPKSGNKKELLGFYHVPDPNSLMSKAIRYMGSAFDTKNNYSNMGKTYGAQGAKFRAKVAKQLRAGIRKAAKNPDNQRNYP